MTTSTWRSQKVDHDATALKRPSVFRRGDSANSANSRGCGVLPWASLGRILVMRIATALALRTTAREVAVVRNAAGVERADRGRLPQGRVVLARQYARVPLADCEQGDVFKREGQCPVGLRRAALRVCVKVSGRIYGVLLCF
jgi:hypothetical protein